MSEYVSKARKGPLWARVCLWVGTPLLVGATAFFLVGGTFVVTVLVKP